MVTQKLSESDSTLDAASKVIKSIPDLTPAQATELLTAQKEALKAEFGKQLSVFQGLISSDTKKFLEDKSVALSSLIPENGIVDRVIDSAKEIGNDIMDGAKNIINGAEWVIKDNNILGAKTASEQKDATVANTMTWAEFFKNPIESLGKLWNVIKECWSSMSFEPLITFFQPSEIIKKIYSGIDILGQKLDLSSAVKESYRELLAEIKEFRELKLGDLMNLQWKTPKEIIAELNLPSSVSENDLKNFMQSFFEEKNFAKVEELSRSAGKSLDELKNMKLSDMLSFLSK